MNNDWSPIINTIKYFKEYGGNYVDTYYNGLLYNIDTGEFIEADYRDIPEFKRYSTIPFTKTTNRNKNTPPYNEETMTIIREDINNGILIKDIAKKLNRTIGAIVSKAIREKIIIPKPIKIKERPIKIKE